jgi:hypothetical protein
MEADDGEIFSPSEAISLLAESSGKYGTSEKTFFHLFRSLGFLPTFVGPFEIRSTANGCTIATYGRRGAYEISVSEREHGTFVTLSAQALADKAGAFERVFSGRDEPDSWLSIIRVITRIEGITVFLSSFIDQLRDGWTEYERVRVT